MKRSRNRKRIRSIHVERDMRNVAVLTPCTDIVHTEFMVSMVEMMQATILAQPVNLHGFGFQGFGTSILPYSRQVLALAALEHGATHLLWIDSDMRFPKDIVLRWLQRDEPIIGINASSRRPPHRNTAQSSPGIEMETTLDSSGIEKCHRTGFGIAWIAAEVFKAIELPWFEFQYVPEMGVFRGEDYGFFEKARAAGYEVHVDHDVSKAVNHIGTFGYNPVLKSMTGGTST